MGSLKTGAFAAVVVIFAWYALAGGNNSNSAPKGGGADATAQWLGQNANDPKALDHKFSDSAQAACGAGGDDYLRSIASNDFAWDSDTQGLFGVKFDKFSTQSAGRGLLTLLSTRAKLSNTFGAFQHITFYCLYDVTKNTVVRYSQNDPADDLPSTSALASSSPAPTINAAAVTDQTSDQPPPVEATTANLTEYNFSDFPSDNYSGPRVAPNFSGAQRPFRQFRTMISDGVKQGPVFAGSVAVAEFGCGADCSTGYAIDLTNGSVVNLPVGGDATLDMVTEYHPGSKLFKAAWTGGSTDPRCAGYGYFEWTGQGFRTLKKSLPSPAECH